MLVISFLLGWCFSSQVEGFTPVLRTYSQIESPEYHWAEQVIVTGNGTMVWVTAPTSWENWGCANVSLDNQSATTAGYFNLNSTVSSYLSTSLAEADILRKGKALDFRFRLSTFGMRVATGAGEITVDVRGTR
jgi:hypothetical protein